VIFFNNAGYLGMCGHGTIGLVASLQHLGLIAPGVHKIDTPVGQVSATLHEDGAVTVGNVPATATASRWRWTCPATACARRHCLGRQLVLPGFRTRPALELDNVKR
jgi:proline racemase